VHGFIDGDTPGTHVNQAKELIVMSNMTLDKIIEIDSKAHLNPNPVSSVQSKSISLEALNHYDSTLLQVEKGGDEYVNPETRNFELNDKDHTTHSIQRGIKKEDSPSIIP